MAGQFIITAAAAAAILDFDGVVFGSSLPLLSFPHLQSDDWYAER